MSERPRFIKATLGLLIVGLSLSLSAGEALSPASAPAIGSLRLIGRHVLPAEISPEGWQLGGLSGLDYDPGADRWLAISDDRSDHGPARCYVLKIDYDQTGISAAAVDEVIILQQADGSNYPDRLHRTKSLDEVPDFESIRLDPREGGFWYASEGDEALGLQPFVRHANRDGKFLGELPRPAMFSFMPGNETGLRANLTFEGITFAPDGRSLWLAVETPLWQDGPVPTLTAGALSRITRLARDGQLIAQYAYPLEPIAVAPAAGKLSDNGVAEILALADQRLLVLERSGRQDETGAWHFAIRLFEADAAGATEVGAVPSLVGTNIRPMLKRLLFDFTASSLPPVENLEGLAWGRTLANGHATFVLVSDDNFDAKQSTQLWVFEVLPISRGSDRS